MLKNIDVFEKDPIPRAVFKLAIPTVLSMIVAVFYNMVDTFFVGRTGDPNQVAAVSVVTPVFLFFMAAGNIFGMGGSSFLSRALGEKQYDKVKKISSFCLYAGILTGVLGAILMLAFMTQILNAVGTSENTFGFAKSYLSWIAYGGP
ncbi:MAG: MATE family efflux transporter, partial [Treponema sp.]|nr:MATE family efflux transporter [Treponema sp.]